MKLLLVLLLLKLLFSSVSLKSDPVPLSKAVSEITSKIFLESSESFDVFIYGNLTYYSRKVLDKFLQQSNSSVNIMKLTKIQESQIIRWTSLKPAVFFVKNIESAKILFNNFRLPVKAQSENYRFLVFIEEVKSKKLLKEIPYEKLTRKFPHLSHHSYYFVNTKKKIYLMTLSLFREDACENYEFQEVGQFDNKKKIWTKLKIEEKFQNFHKCLIVWRASYSNKKYWQFLVDDFLKIVAQKGNLTYYVQWDLPNSEFIPQDGKTVNYHADFIVTPLIATSYKTIHVTSTFIEVSYVFVLTPGEKYSSYEKMLLPFDFDTWMFLIITFGTAFLVVFILRFMPKNVRNSVIGSQVSHPSYDILGSFFGISQHKLPKEISPRILLTFFVFFCLIFRTAYQSVLFGMMTTDMRKKLPTTIDGLYEKNFIIVLFADKLSADYPILTRMISEDRRPKLMNITATEFEGDGNFVNYYLENIKNDSVKLAFFMDDGLEKKLASKFKIDGIQLEQKLFSTTAGFGYRKNCFLIYLVEKVLKKIITTGIIQKLWKDTLLRGFSPPKKEPKVLGVDDLEFGFVVWLVAAMISLIGFLFEFFAFKFLRKIKFYLKSKVKKIVGYILVLMQLKNLYFKSKN